MDDAILFIFWEFFLLKFLKKILILKKLKNFICSFIFFFHFITINLFKCFIINDFKRTDYPGKEIARLVQNKWDDNFINDIKIVVGDEWFAGNLSYHLDSRPKWINDLKNKEINFNDDQGSYLYW